MHMRMWHFESDNRNAAAVAIKRFLNSICNRFCKYKYPRKEFLFQVEKKICFGFRYYQCMTFPQRICIQKSKEEIILCNAVSGNFSIYDFREYGHKGKLIVWEYGSE